MRDQTTETLREIETKLDEVDALVAELPIRNAIKDKISNMLGEIFEEASDAVDLSPVDWE